MRSLFVDDIPGAKPTHRYYDKVLYRQKLTNQIERFGPQGSDYKHIYKWSQPHKKPIQPIQKKEFPIKLFNYFHNSNFKLNPEDISSSLMLSRKSKQNVTSKVTQIQHRLNKSSLLSGTGQQSLVKQVPISEDNPYFPHKYIDKNLGEQNKWRGTRFWNENYTKLINIPKQSERLTKKYYQQ